MNRILAAAVSSAKRLRDVATHDYTAARAAHEADNMLNWLRWDQLPHEVHEEYRRNAENGWKA